MAVRVFGCIKEVEGFSQCQRSESRVDRGVEGLWVSSVSWCQGSMGLLMVLSELWGGGEGLKGLSVAERVI